MTCFNAGIEERWSCFELKIPLTINRKIVDSTNMNKHWCHQYCIKSPAPPKSRNVDEQIKRIPLLAETLYCVLDHHLGAACPQTPESHMSCKAATVKLRQATPALNFCVIYLTCLLTHAKKAPQARSIRLSPWSILRQHQKHYIIEQFLPGCRCLGAPDGTSCGASEPRRWVCWLGS